MTPENEYDPAWDTWTPAYTSPTTEYPMDEDAAYGDTVLTIAATDADGWTDGVVEYSITSVTDSKGPFFNQVLVNCSLI